MACPGQRLPTRRETYGQGECTSIPSTHPLKEKDTGQQRLESLGYHQELKRKFTKWTSCCSGFALMSFLLALVGSLPTVWTFGGPVVAVWGFVIVAVCSFLVALSLAELSSSYPLAGGPYFWCLELTDNDPRYTIFAFGTGYLNVLGQAANLGCSAYLTADCINFMVEEVNGHKFSPLEMLLTYAILLLVFGLIASMPTGFLMLYTSFSGVFLLIGGALLIIVMLALAPSYRSASWVFGGYRSGDAEAVGISHWGYIWTLGIVANCFSFIGLESPAQFSEETKKADRHVPYGIVAGVLWEAVMGLAFILAFLFCLPEDEAVLQEGINNSHFVQTIFISIIKTRLGNPAIGVALIGILLVAIFNSTVLAVAVNARMLWSFSREGGIFLYRVWAAVDRRLGVPLNATWAMTALALLIGLPLLRSNETFFALASISSVGLNLSYVAPIVLRLRKGKDFAPGAFSMGRAQPWVNAGALAFILFSTMGFCLPSVIPVVVSNFNWTPVMVGLILGAVLIVWYLPSFGARHWYHGKAHLSEDTSVRGGGRYQNGEANYGRPTIPLTVLIAEVMAKQDASDGKGRRSAVSAAGAVALANSHKSYKESLRTMRLVERQV